MTTGTKEPNDKLRAAIQAAGMKQHELARALWVGESQVSRWVNGATPRRLQQREIARKLGVKPEELW